MIGNQTPTYSWCAPYEYTEGGLASELADAYGLAPHPWQRTILNDWLALDADGKLLNALCVLDVSRQNGKTGVCDPRETWGLIGRGEAILHTAQEYQTSKKAFDRLREKFGTKRNDPMAKYPELNAMVQRYTTSANQMVLDLKNGGHIEFRTRGDSGDMGRGGTFDLVVVDEAQTYTEAQDASLSPLVSAAPKGSPQFILMGTSPDPDRPLKSEVFTRVRASLVNDHDMHSCIHEWGTNEIGDVLDRERWYMCNPSLGLQLLESALESDAKKMRPEVFAREHLGYWPPEAQTNLHPISETKWKACKTDKPPKDGLLVYAVKFSIDGATVALSVCVKPENGKPHVEVVEYRSMAHGIDWLVNWLSQRKHKAAQIVIDGKGYNTTLADRLLDTDVERAVIVIPNANDVYASCSAFLNAVNEGQVTHYGQKELDTSATKCRKRKIGSSGGWGFQSTEESDAILVESCALAYREAQVTKRNPNRKVEIW